MYRLATIGRKSPSLSYIFFIAVYNPLCSRLSIKNMTWFRNWHTVRSYTSTWRKASFHGDMADKFPSVVIFTLLFWSCVILPNYYKTAVISATRQSCVLVFKVVLCLLYGRNVVRLLHKQYYYVLMIEILQYRWKNIVFLSTGEKRFSFVIIEIPGGRQWQNFSNSDKAYSLFSSHERNVADIAYEVWLRNAVLVLLEY